MLVVAGDGSRRAALAYRAARLPVRFAGHIADRAAVAALLASADVVLAPGPVETFGLAALEALACGTPVVVNEAERAARGGRRRRASRCAGTPEAFADGVRRLMDAPRGRAPGRRPGPGRAVRLAAGRWTGFLRAHGARRRRATCRWPAPLRPAVPAGRGTLRRSALPYPRSAASGAARHAGADGAGTATSNA